MSALSRVGSVAKTCSIPARGSEPGVEPLCAGHGGSDRVGRRSLSDLESAQAASTPEREERHLEG